MSLLLIVLIALVVLALGWGGYSAYGGPRYGPVVGWSPLALLLVFVLVLWLAGALRP